MRYWVNSQQVINETIDGEAIMIDLATGAYYSLDRVGGDIWTVLEQGATADEIVEALDAKYEAARDELEAGVNGLLERLVAEKLIIEAEETGDAGAAGPPPAPAMAVAKQPFTPPRLDKFTDMQDLILLDPVHEVDSRGWPHTLPSSDASG